MCRPAGAQLAVPYADGIGTVTAPHAPQPGPAPTALVAETAADDAYRAAHRTAALDRRGPHRPTLSLVIPTYNEAENLPILVAQLTEVLALVDYELIVVDDNSPDGTWRVAEELSETNSRVRSIRRVGERGLSSAVMTGMSVAKGDVLAVMDADLQHDASILPRMLDPIVSGQADVVVGSREAEGGSYGEWTSGRRSLSVAGASLARTLTGTPVTDPMSGFFAISRDHHDRVAASVNPRGFKILLEFLARGPAPRVAEVGYTFGLRRHGETKLTTSVAFSYLISLIGLVTGRAVSATLTAYLVVGLAGVIIQMAALAALSVTLTPALAASIAFEISVLANYWLNNQFTFAADRRRGRRVLTGLLPFHLVAAHGLIVQFGLVSLFWGPITGFGDGPLGYRLAGIALATAGNYALHRNLTWRPRSGLVALA